MRNLLHQHGATDRWIGQVDRTPSANTYLFTKKSQQQRIISDFMKVEEVGIEFTRVGDPWLSDSCQMFLYSSFVQKSITSLLEVWVTVQKIRSMNRPGTFFCQSPAEATSRNVKLP